MKARRRRLSRLVLDFSVVAGGGSTTYAVGFLDALARRPPDPHIVVLLPAPPALIEQETKLKEVGLNVVRTKTADPGSWRSRIQAQFRLPLWMLRLSASRAFVPRDIVPLLSPGRMTMFANNRLAWESLPGPDEATTKVRQRLRLAVSALGASRAVAVIATSKAMAECLPDRIRHKTVVIHQGCDLRLAARSSPGGGGRVEGEPVKAIALGAMSPHKAMHVVIETVGDLRRRGLYIDLDMWGPPGNPDVSETLNDFAQRSLGESPLRGPFESESRSVLFEGADLLIMGSSFESFGHPMVEAMRTNTVVVAPSSSLVTELCGDAAVTFQEGSSESAADAIESALPHLETLARRGLERSQAFSWDSCVAQTLEVCLRA